jgi:hypothetical protein
MECDADEKNSMTEDIMKKHITNFSPAEYFGCEGSPPQTGPWAKWFSGEDLLLGEAFGEFLWWHLCEIMLLFRDMNAAHNPSSVATAEAFEAKLNSYLSLAESHLGGSLRLVNLFEFDSDMLEAPGVGVRTQVMLLLAYGVWCADRIIDALRSSDAQTAAFASSNAFRALELVHEYREDFPEVKARAESKKQSERARARHAKDPKQKDKAFVRECWERWQESRGDYKSKAAFALAMLDKCEHLESPKQIEDWCRAWEKEKRRAAGILRIVPAS